MTMYPLLVTCPKGLEYLLEEELKALGLEDLQVNPQGVKGQASLKTIYQISLWSRIANRVLLILIEESAPDPQTLHAICRSFSWDSIFSSYLSMAIHFQGTSESFRNSMFGAQIIKDGIVDYCRDQDMPRPNIDREHADVRLRAYLRKDVVTIGLDLVGYSLHQRGYRLEAGAAPLKETTAAALLVRAKWPELCKQEYSFYDPLCGSGTLVIEAAMMAACIAPGLLRQDQLFASWSAHDSLLWAECRAAALAQQIVPKVVLSGSDYDSRVILMAKANAERAGVATFTNWKVQSLSLDEQAPTPQGLLVCNPPYGERISDMEDLLPLYQTLGEVLHHSFANWEAAVLTSEPALGRAIGLRSHKQYRFYNGPLACQLYCFHLNAQNRLQKDAPPKILSENAQMFANRLKKNKKHLASWVQRQQIEAYRIYDADLPEYAYAIDIYKDYAVLQEYAPPATIDPKKAEQRRQEVQRAVPEVLGFTPDHIIVKQRVRQRGTQQYEKTTTQKELLVVKEDHALFYVNLYDYLDTGLFLDHRLLRKRFAQLPSGTRFLNCFCYTGTASVQAALAGARTTNVDLSRTYLTWAENNFQLNNIEPSKHQFIQYDCIEWLSLTRDRFDVIFLDPPSFSNSKRMTQTLDIARDHEDLIRKCIMLLAPGGTLYFSCNLRQFKLNPVLEQEFSVRNITKDTIDMDFKRNDKIHHCYMVQAK